jgi:hypothetical protein
MKKIKSKKQIIVAPTSLKKKKLAKLSKKNQFEQNETHF